MVAAVPVAAARRRGGTIGTTSLTGANNAGNASVGDSNGMSLPAVLNEVISVTGVYSFPYDQTPGSPPTDRINGVLPNPLGPILLFGQLTYHRRDGVERHGGYRRRGGGAGGGARRGHQALATSTPMLNCLRRPIS